MPIGQAMFTSRSNFARPQFANNGDSWGSGEAQVMSAGDRYARWQGKGQGGRDSVCGAGRLRGARAERGGIHRSDIPNSAMPPLRHIISTRAPGCKKKEG